MKILLILIGSLLFTATELKAQDTTLLKNYSLTVVMKVKDIASVVNLTPVRQVQFADFFKQEMGQMQSIISSNLSDVQIRTAQANLYAQFSALLTPAELSAYSSKKKGSPYAIVVTSPIIPPNATTPSTKQ